MPRRTAEDVGRLRCGGGDAEAAPARRRGAGARQPSARRRSRAGPRAHARPPHESPWLMTVPLVVLAVLSIVGGLINLPFSHDLQFLELWLEPSLGQRGASRRRPPARRSGWPSCAGRRRPRRASRWRRASTCSSAATRRSSRRPRRRLVLRQPHLRVHGRPGPGRLRGHGRFDRTVDRRRRQRRRHRRARRRQAAARRVQTGFVRSYALGVAVGAVAPPRLLPHPGRPSDAALAPRRRGRHGRRLARRSPRRSSLPVVGALAVAADPRGTRRAAPPRRPALLRRARGAITVWMLADFDRQRRRLPVRRRPHAGSPTSASPGTSASTASRCSSSCSPGVLFPLAIFGGRRPTTTRRRTTRGCSCCRPAAWACSGARPVPVLRVLRDRARADVLPDRRVGPRPTGVRRRSSSSSTRCSARRSCSSGIVALAFLHRDGVREDASTQVGRGPGGGRGPDRRTGRRRRGARPAERPANQATVRGAVDPGGGDRRRRARSASPSSDDPSLDFDLVTIAEAQHVSDRRRARTRSTGARRAGSSSPSRSRSP